MRFAQAVVAFLLLPGTVGFLVPLLLRPPTPIRTFHPIGLVPLTIGAIILLACVRAFYVEGRGTLAPWAPPTRLVTSGLYRFSRNPMYVGVSLILLGWAMAYQARGLLIYALVVIAAFHLRIVWFEEPWLGRTHVAGWPAYRAGVRRWL